MRTQSSVEIFLRPGEYFVGNEQHRIRTLLGSCVSITLWNAERRIGAMSHCLLATRQSLQIAEPDGRYIDEALALMLRKLKAAKVQPKHLQAKLFGGGDMFPQHSKRSAAPPIGHSNGIAARELLRVHGIPIVSESLYGSGHRQLVFDIGSGEVWARQVQPQGPFVAVAKERL